MAEREPAETGTYAAAETALEHLHQELGVPRERTVLQGQSLGSGVAVEMAERGHGSRLVLAGDVVPQRHRAPSGG